MALSDDQIVNIWGREPRYHAAPIGSTDIAFARAIEAEVRKQDDALIPQLIEAPTYQQVIAAWNAQADEHNQWDALGEDEKIEWAVACAKAAPPTTGEPRWYMVNKSGMATLCTDREDAERAASDAQAEWPRLGPHRAVQLIEIGCYTPPAVVPIGWYVTGCSRILDEHDAKAEARHIGGSAKALPLCTAPAVVEPLTDEQIRAMCKESWVFETVKQWVRITEQHHGIKGGQHG